MTRRVASENRTRTVGHRPDMAAPEVALDPGDHNLALALGANQGRAWGIFLQLQRTDLAATATPILVRTVRV